MYVVSETRTPSRQVPILPGVVAGQAAWVVGYLLTFAVVWTADHNRVLRATLGDAAPAPDLYQTVGWVFFNAHTVGITVEPARQAGSPDPFTTELVGAAGFTPVLYAVPVVILIAAGASVAFATGSYDPRTGMVAGLAVVPGYLALCIAGTLATSTAWSMGPGGTASAEALAVVVRAGVLYPAVCSGGAGALVGAVLGVSGTPPGPGPSQPEPTADGDHH
jgi:hypothetical protein